MGPEGGVGPWREGPEKGAGGRPKTVVGEARGRGQERGRG